MSCWEDRHTICFANGKKTTGWYISVGCLSGMNCMDENLSVEEVGLQGGWRVRVGVEWVAQSVQPRSQEEILYSCELSS